MTVARFTRLIVGSGLAGVDNGDGTITIAVTATGGVSPTDTAGWLPLTTVVAGTPDLVWDADDDLIPTYGPF